MPLTFKSLTTGFGDYKKSKEQIEFWLWIKVFDKIKFNFFSAPLTRPEETLLVLFFYFVKFLKVK